LNAGKKFKKIGVEGKGHRKWGGRGGLLYSSQCPWKAFREWERGAGVSKGPEKEKGKFGRATKGLSKGHEEKNKAPETLLCERRSGA